MPFGEAPGIPLEQARVATPGHAEGHARHREVLQRLDRVIALLAELVDLVQRNRPPPPPPPAPARPAPRRQARPRPGEEDIYPGR
jgi:hypothetical protein